MKRKITLELVFELADQLAGQGITPTNLKIRDLNDCHGSLSTITPHLKAWRDARSREGVDAVPAMPEDKLLQLLRPVWSELARESQQLFAEERAAIGRDSADLHSQLAAVSAEVDRQESIIDDAIQTNKSLTARLDDLRSLSEKQGDELIGLHERISARDNQIAELKRRLDDADQLSREATARAETLQTELLGIAKQGSKKIEEN